MKTLYKKDSKGKIRQWDVSVTDSTITVSSGLLDGKKTSQVTTCKGKNIGKANETSPEEQALLEAQAKWTKQVEREDYHWDVDLSGNQLRPQLALDYTKVGHRVRWENVVGQPKLDGCFSKDTKIITNKGSVNIADIRVGDKVMSLNETTGELEAKEVLNTFYNGKCGDFLSIVTERNKVRGKRSSALTVTPNHRVLINGEWGQVKDLKVGDSLSEVTDLIYKQKVMLGLLLGDGCLSSEKRLLPHSESLRVIYSQLEEKKPCIDFIGNLLGLDYNLHSRVSGYGSSTLTLTTKALTFNGFELNKLFDLNTDSSAYGKRKDIPYEYLKSYFDEIAFSLWYMGDGSIRYNNDNTNTPVMSISTHRYSSKQILDFQNLFRVKFNCTPTIIEDKRHKRQDGTYKSTLTFNTKDTLYLLNILKTYQIPSYDYKYYFKGDSSGFSSSGSVLEDDKVVAINPVKTVLGKYDIEVKDNHNYIANNRVVHNCRMLYGSKDKGGSGAEFITRKGETYNVEHLVEPCKSLLERINNGLPEGLVCLALDGEIYKHGLPLQKIVSGAKKYHKGLTESLEFHIFDLVIEGMGFDERYGILVNTFPIEDTPIKLVGTIPSLDNPEDAKKAVGHCMAKGYEGLMLRHLDGEYVIGKRSPDLFKYKEFQDKECKIVDMWHDKNSNAMFTCLFDHTNVESSFNCTPKRSHEERKLMQKEAYIGKWLTVKYQDLTDDGLPTFPVGLDLRDCDDEGNPLN